MKSKICPIITNAGKRGNNGQCTLAEDTKVTHFSSKP